MTDVEVEIIQPEAELDISHKISININLPINYPNGRMKQMADWLESNQATILPVKIDRSGESNELSCIVLPIDMEIFNEHSLDEIREIFSILTKELKANHISGNSWREYYESMNGKTLKEIVRTWLAHQGTSLDNLKEALEEVNNIYWALYSMVRGTTEYESNRMEGLDEITPIPRELPKEI